MKQFAGILVAVLLALPAACRAEAGEEKKDEPQVDVKDLCYKLSSNDEGVRWAAAAELIKAGKQPTELLSGILRGEWLEGRKLAAYILGETKDPAAVPALASCLGDPEFHIRWKCAVSLKNIGRPSVEALVDTLRLGNLDAQYCAAWTLGEIKHPKATLALAETAASDDYHLRWKSVISLKRIGPPAIAELKKVLRSDKPAARRSAVWGLDQIGGKDVVEPLIAATRDPDEEVRCKAVEGLAKFDLPEVRKALEKLANDGSAAVKRLAMVSLAKLGKNIEPAGENGLPGAHVPQWALHEVSWEAPRDAADGDGSLEVLFLSPSQGSVSVRGFHAGGTTWKARVSPGEPGEWFYKMTFAAGGKTAIEHGMFSCDKSELAPGLEMKLLPRPHIDAGGKPLHLVEAPLPQSPPNDLDEWKRVIDACADHGFNLLRLDLPAWFGALHAAGVPARTAEARRLLDAILSHGHTRGVYFLLTLFDERRLRDAAWWSGSPLNAANGGPIAGAVFPAFYDPLTPEIARPQERYITDLVARTGGCPNVLYELCRHFNERDAAVPFAASWARTRSELFRGCPRPVMLSMAPGAAAEPGSAAGIGIVASEGAAPPGKLPAVAARCPGDPAEAASLAWAAAVGRGGLVTWEGCDLRTVDELMTWLGRSADYARVLVAAVSSDDVCTLQPEGRIVLAAPPGVQVHALGSRRRALLYLAGSANGGEAVKIGMAAGAYDVRWMDIRTGAWREGGAGRQDSGVIELQAPRFSGGIVADVNVR